MNQQNFDIPQPQVYTIRENCRKKTRTFVPCTSAAARRSVSGGCVMIRWGVIFVDLELVALDTIDLIIVVVAGLMGYILRELIKSAWLEVRFAYSWHHREHCLWKNIGGQDALKPGG